jgi:hypothetical protein
MGQRRVIMARVLRPGQVDDGSFDSALWRQVGREGILEAAWDMVNEARAIRGLAGDEPRLQRTVVRSFRRKV